MDDNAIVIKLQGKSPRDGAACAVVDGAAKRLANGTPRFIAGVPVGVA
ncbi:MAG TPA: hypothetical protein VFU88_21325 [Ktedonobacterales bacterium]|nr:hypothetical protein [Ktedonobacterales bacterium]